MINIVWDLIQKSFLNEIKEATMFFVEVNIAKVIDAATKFHRFEICP